MLGISANQYICEYPARPRSAPLSARGAAPESLTRTSPDRFGGPPEFRYRDKKRRETLRHVCEPRAVQRTPARRRQAAAAGSGIQRGFRGWSSVRHRHPTVVIFRAAGVHARRGRAGRKPCRDGRCSGISRKGLCLRTGRNFTPFSAASNSKASPARLTSERGRAGRERLTSSPGPR